MSTAEDRPERKLYLGRYLVAVYDENDWCVGVWCNPKEMEDETGIRGIRSSVNCITVKKTQKYLYVHGLKCRLYLIPWEQG